MALTKEELDKLLAELKPHVDTPEHRLATGLAAYTALFKAHPEYISHFSRLQGLNASNVMQSEGIKHYATTLIDATVNLLSAAANGKELEGVTKKYGQDHVTRQVNQAEFMSGLPVFISVFQSLLHDSGNKASVEKFLKHIFPAISAEIKA
ncbi:unnamed protein product [Calicophoron daubneyi]|uniref:Globin domain-containing protein n=1 Tax=Calicophoron daubneyi TaxID=300641 RepID=A0AAV2TKS1_CALDB